MYAGNNPLIYIDPLGLWKAENCGGYTCYRWENEDDTWESLAKLLRVSANSLSNFFQNTTLGEGTVLDTDNFLRNHWRSDLAIEVRWSEIDELDYQNQQRSARIAANQIQFEPGIPSAGTARSIARGATQIVGRNRASQVLARNLIQHGISQPAKTAAHHIVPFGAKRAAVAKAVLSKFGIDINSAENGVFLSQAIHTGRHGNAYIDFV